MSLKKPKAFSSGDAPAKNKNLNNDIDMVNHPPHYDGSSSLECIQAMRIIFGSFTVFNYCVVTSFKYVWRCKNKGSFKRDLDKAKWYLNYATNIANESGVADEMPLNKIAEISWIIRELEEEYNATENPSK